MQNKKLEINYLEYSGLEELEPKDRELCEAAEKALTGSYAPYSKFNVGAAVRLSDGRTGKVILINDNALSEPIVQCGNEFVDLSKQRGLSITAIL